MNVQLNLIGLEDFGTTQPRKQSEHKQRSHTQRSPNMNEWWKLSNEERQQGLAGVRTIRAILQKCENNATQEMRKAS